MSFYWRPNGRLGASAGYNHTKVARLTNSYVANLERSLLFSNVSYAITKAVRFTLRYTDQKIETAFPGAVSKFAIETRTLSVGNTYKFNSNWSNTIEGRITFNREVNAGASLERGFSLNEQLRFGWDGRSMTAFLHYNRKSPSLTSLIVRSPGLLPPALQAAFALDPAEFLRVNQDRMAFLLSGIELPQTRSTAAGVRFQQTVSRFNMSGSIRYNAGEVYAVNKKELYTTVSLSIRLDRANSVHVNAWKALGGVGRSGASFSYTHKLGSSGGGFQFSNLVGLNRGKVRGRVFYDLNGNGQYDVTEPGVAGMKVQLDEKRSLTTDNEGRYELSADGGRHEIALVSARLGVQLLASTPTEQTIIVNRGQKLDLSFGVRDHGSISGSVLNDAGTLIGAQPSLALAGVRVILRAAGNGNSSFVLEQLTPADGSYLFPNLRPGSYLVEIDPASLPPNYRIPGITGSSVIVGPLQNSTYNMSFGAQRAVTGVVYLDRDGDGLYTPGKDKPIEGASVLFNGKAAVSDVNGGYILRDLPPGRIELSVASPTGFPGPSISLELGAKPATKRAVNIPLSRK
jgi:hypothetical protein